MSEFQKTETTETDDVEYKIEAYLDVPAQDLHDSYGMKTGHVERGDWCCRYVIRLPRSASHNDALAKALVQVFDDPETQDILGGARRYTIRVIDKYGPPEWKVEVDHD